MHTLTYQRYAVCVNIERDLRCTQKRPIHMAKEAYSYDKWDLFIWQKRPIHMAKETYAHTHIPGKPQVQLAVFVRLYVYVRVHIYTHGKRGLYLWTHSHTRKATGSIGPTWKNLWQVSCLLLSPDDVRCGMRKCQERPTKCAKETYSCDKRDLFMWQKRPMNTLTHQKYAVCASVKRGLQSAQRDPFIWQKRPMNTLTYLRYAACVRVKRGLLY